MIAASLWVGLLVLPLHAPAQTQLGLGVRLVNEDRLGLALCEELCALCSDSGATERANMSAALAAAVPLDAAARLWEELALLAEHKRASTRRK